MQYELFPEHLPIKPEKSKETETIDIDLSLEEIGRIALMAHERDMKLNDFIIEAVKKHIAELNIDFSDDYLTDYGISDE
jgi:hypothetical protein